MKLTAMEYLEQLAEEIVAEHRSGVCNHYGACEYVAPFVEYMRQRLLDAAEFEEWATEVGFEELYSAIFYGGARIDKVPEHHVSDVARFHEICRAHGIDRR